MFDPKPRHHKLCFLKPREKDPRRQTTLFLSPTRLGFVVPTPKSYPRTPVPNRIRRTTHTPFFSTDDRSLCSFFRLPYEIRHLIYQELLYYGRIQYEICLSTSRLILLEFCVPSRRIYPYRRHGIHPAILECCHQINGEGSRVLYGENHFKISRCTGTYPVTNSWALTRRSLELITKLNVGCWILLPNAYDTPMVAQVAQPFVSLRHIALSVQILPGDWGKFLELSAEYLNRMQSGLVMFSVDFETMDDIAERERARVGPSGSWTRNVELAKSSLLRYCEAIAAKHMPTKDIRWDFLDESDQWGFCWDVHMMWGNRDLIYTWYRTKGRT